VISCCDLIIWDHKLQCDIIVWYYRASSSPASSTATPIQLFPSNSRTADSLVQRLPIPRRIAGTAADSTRWISGCGATDWSNPGRFPLRRRRLSGGSKWGGLGPGRRRQRNRDAAGRRPPESAQQNEIVFSLVTQDITYDIIYDIADYDIIVSVMLSYWCYDITSCDIMLYNVISW
jgi:hypothetical protein